jgi:hypothetical protein
MNSIQTALQKVIPMMTLNNLTFDDDVGTTTAAPEMVLVEGKVNITQTIWAYVKSKTGVTTREVEAGLPQYASGVSTRLNQLLASGKVIRNEDSHGVRKWYAVGDVYPLVYGKGRPKSVANKKVKKVKKIAKPRTYHAKPAVKRDPAFDVNAFVENLTILQAKELRDRLNQFFK